LGGGLGLDQIERLAGAVKVLLQNPMLDLSAAIGEDDAVEFVFDGGFGLGCRSDGCGGCRGVNGA